MDRKRAKDGTRGDNPTHDPGRDLSRRDFIEGTGAALVVAGTTPALAAADPGGVSDPTVATPQQAPAVPTTQITLTVNGTAHTVDAQDRWTLNELLRDHLGLVGSKIGCNRGECGACTVLLDGEPVYSCSTLAVWAAGRSVMTVEGLEDGGGVTALQQAFIDHNAAQCGFCTPGQLMSATALLERTPRPSVDDVRHALAGNLCRCSNYNAIVEAVLAAAGSSASGGGR